MKIQQTTRQLQKQILSPIMQQSIELLQLPLGELTQAIEAEIESNPVLEIDDVEATLSRYLNEVVHNKQYNEESAFSASGDTFFNDDDPSEEKQIASHTSLGEHLLSQLRIELNDPFEIKIGELLIHNINADGYFEGSIPEIAENLNTSDTDLIEKVLFKIHQFDPIGVGARHLRECLLAQAAFHFKDNTTIINAIISNHLNDLAMKKFELIARSLQLSIEQVKCHAKQIATLEPKPARVFSETPSSLYVKPDITIVEEDGVFIAKTNNDYIPQLRVSNAYRKMLMRPKSTKEEKTFIKDKIKNALLFIRSIEQRQNTIKQIADYIALNQQEFFKEGYSRLKPMTLSDIAQAIDRNESTISRAICNKYADTPQGTFSLKYFFSQGVNQSGEDSISNRSIKEELLTIIEEENKAKPYSDQEILEILSKRKMQVARRTISKYRQELNILPSHLRKE